MGAWMMDNIAFRSMERRLMRLLYRCAPNAVMKLAAVAVQNMLTLFVLSLHYWQQSTLDVSSFVPLCSAW